MASQEFSYFVLGELKMMYVNSNLYFRSPDFI